jgi:hypothetical protein
MNAVILLVALLSCVVAFVEADVLSSSKCSLAGLKDVLSKTSSYSIGDAVKFLLPDGSEVIGKVDSSVAYPSLVYHDGLCSIDNDRLQIFDYIKQYFIPS